MWIIFDLYLGMSLSYVSENWVCILIHWCQFLYWFGIIHFADMNILPNLNNPDSLMWMPGQRLNNWSEFRTQICFKFTMLHGYGCEPSASKEMHNSVHGLWNTNARISIFQRTEVIAMIFFFGKWSSLLAFVCGKGFQFIIANFFF